MNDKSTFYGCMASLVVTDGTVGVGQLFAKT
jgi:hypothetical protein